MVITGMPGVGKTLLAIEWAWRRIDRFPDGVLYANLRGYSPGEPLPPGTVLRGFLDALGTAPNRVPEDPGGQARLYRSLIADKRMLIILDDAGDSSQVMPLLPGTASCTVMVTSRGFLPELTARYGGSRLKLDTLPEPESRSLLAHLVGAERAAAEPGAIDELVRAGAGLPLALTLLGGRAQAHPQLALADIAAQIRTAVLEFDDLDPDTSLYSVLSWSYRALPDDVARPFRLMSLAPGPDFGLNAAATLNHRSIDETRRALAALEGAHLVERRTPDRYALHDLVRTYALELVRSVDGEADQSDARDRVIDFYLHTAKDANQQLSQRKNRLELGQLVPGAIPLTPADAAEALTWFDTEHICLLAVQRMAATSGRYNAVWQLAVAMDTYLRRKGSLDDRLASWRTALAAAEHLGDPAPLVLALRRLGDACSRAGQHTEALDLAQRCLGLADPAAAADQAETHRTLAMILERQGDRERALDHALQALDRVRSLGDGLAEAEVLNAVARYAAQLGHFDQALDHCRAAQELHRYHPDRAGEADTLDTLGYLAHHSGEYSQALTLYREALQLRRDLHDHYQVADTLRNLGEIHAGVGDYHTARRYWTEALKLFTDQGRAAEADDTQRQVEALHHSAPGDAEEEVTVHTSGDDGQQVRDALVDLLQVAGFDVISGDVPQHGSWFQRLFVTQKNSRGGEELGRLVAAAVANHLGGTVNGSVVQGRDIHLNHNTAGAGPSEQEANAIARLLEACQAQDEVAVCTSSFVLVKVDGRITCWVPTTEAMRVLRANPHLLHSPRELFSTLSRLPESITGNRSHAGQPPTTAHGDFPA
ncbi:Transcriptional regulator, SARP family protein [Amycolatopsis vancoresmycina DSM 44592]|uniref:Transcriptional regulator, SARP family protein n=1 Tax=Amycolatopsis vancoresmycina DSM 44592 TaxID=1292037 RepID=R1HIH3_9PSEU|nr:Transcriptional regulator, SARP family protein [Amycolatopsis vancoresmycina DSM 44592]